MRLSVIIANRNDTVMLGVTVRSAIEEISAIPGGGEVVIVDNSDQKYKEAIRSIIPSSYIRDKTVKWAEQPNPCLFTARDNAVKIASGDYVFCVDSHCIIGHNVLIDAVNFMNRNKNTKIGFGHTPVNWLAQHEKASRHDMALPHGTWGNLYNREVPITWKGMPWICRKDWFINKLHGYGSLSENKMSWGGGDMYLGLKSWMLGYENWAIPARPTIHIGPLPVKAREFCSYRQYGTSGQGNVGMGYLVALAELGGENYAKSAGFASFIMERHGLDVNKEWEYAEELAFKEKKYIEQNRVMSFDDMISSQPWGEKVTYKNAINKILFAADDTQKSIKKEDWDLLEKIVVETNVKHVLEFGAGASTMLFDSLGCSVLSIEPDKDYADKISNLVSDNVKIVQEMNGNKGKFDLIFVDGPLPREPQAEIAKEVGGLVVVHDGRKRQCGYRAALMFNDWKELENNTMLSRVFARMEMKYP